MSPVKGEITAAQGGTSAAGSGHLPSGGPGSDTCRMSLRGNEHPQSQTRTPVRVKQGADTVSRGQWLHKCDVCLR